MSYYPTERRGGCMESISTCCRQAYVYPLDTRKLLFIGGGLTGVILVAVIWSSLSSGSTKSEPSGSSILKEHPFAVGCNFFSSNLRDLVHNQVSEVNFKNTKTLGNVTCSTCQTDIPRLQTGAVSIQFWSINVPCDAMYKDAVALTLEQLDAMSRLINTYPSYMSSVTTSSEIQHNFNSNSKLISSILAVNSGHSIDGRLAVLRTFKTLGVRVMGLTSNCSTDWATSYNHSGTDDGLSSFGLEVVKEMNRLGILVDLSESSPQTQLDVLGNTSAPVIFSHAAAYNISNNTRNIKDNVLDLLKTKTAILMVTFAESYLNNTSSNASIDTVIEHLKYFKNKVGATKIGIGGEFDGSNLTYPSVLNDVSKFPTLFDTLKTNGWTTEELINLAGGNLLRVLKEAEQYAFNHANDAVDEAYLLQENSPCYSDYESRKTANSLSTTATTAATTNATVITTTPTTTKATSTVATTTISTNTTAAANTTNMVTTTEKPTTVNKTLTTHN